MKTKYKTYSSELLAIFESFQIWKHYLKDSQHDVLIFTNHKNLRQFIETKSLSSKQARCTQKVSHYHFWIDYCQGKANGAADALSQYTQQSAEKKETLRARNIKILHRLELLLARISRLLMSRLSPFYQVLICGTTVLPQFYQFWESLWSKIAQKCPNIANIGGIRLCLPEL